LASLPSCQAPMTRFLLLSGRWEFLDMMSPLRREDGSVAYCAASPHQSSHSWSESHRAHDHTLLFHVKLPQLEDQVPIFISPRSSVAQLYPRHWVPFSSPLTSDRDAVQVFDLSPHGVLLTGIHWRSLHSLG
jgi:hypothetical protein